MSKFCILYVYYGRTSVCDFIKPKLQVEERQWNWFTPETCEAQYKQLHNECVKLQINCEDPVMQILQNLKSRKFKFIFIYSVFRIIFLFGIM